MADEESVDVDDRRDNEPAPEPGPQAPAIPAATRLSPLQESWGAYVDHATHCEICRSPDDGKCDTAESLYRAYEAQGAEAYRRLAGS